MTKKTNSSNNSEGLENVATPKQKYRDIDNIPAKTILFGKENYTLIVVGLAIVLIGFFLMSGGQQASPDEWSEEIYSFQRITLAPIVILTGLGVVILSIFKTPSNASSVQNINHN